MNRIALNVELRDQTGKGPARRLRAAGKIPAIFYGKKTEPIKIAIDLHSFKKVYDQAGSNPVFELQGMSGSGRPTRVAVLKERQINPVDSSFVHMDFLEVFMDEAIQVSVPLEFTGKCVGVELGGMFQAAARDVLVSCLPDRIPDVIRVDITELRVGHSIHVGELALPEGVSALQDPKLAIATVLAPKKGEAAEATEEPAGSKSGSD
jgi:large subunit ribosomal protein L25